MKVEYAVTMKSGVISFWHNKVRMSYTKLEDIIESGVIRDNINVEQAKEYKKIADNLLNMNLMLFISETIKEPGGNERPIKASAVIGSNRFELDLRTMEQIITPLK